ncbi:ABC transporter [Halovivax asiaticus JCM 14624]|uniref:ABC transporter n=1 Tax=Halovivax asiaticus JCM 14624 TaxID=1227490 RepID=M0BGE5_9EURY|nr:ABC transporter permease subunit [Halovivax asiaticus]ELZ09925.1 ABC transporter [Halovivax asiaticus JCM 14624]
MNRLVGTPRRLLLYAREDALDARREHQVHTLWGLFGLVGLVITYTASQGTGAGVRSEPVGMVASLFAPLVLLVPLVALGFVATTIVEKRRSGALTVLLGLPFARRTVVLGTLLGRSAVIASAPLIALLAALPVALATDVAVDPGRLIAAAVALSLLATTFVAIAVAISTLARSTMLATVTAFGAYVVFVFDGWSQLPAVIRYVIHGFERPETTATWVEVVAATSPITAFANMLAGISPSLTDASIASAAENPELWEEPAVAGAILVGWIVASTGIAAWRFRATDI